MKPHRGTLILVLGILSLVICQPLGIAAWVMGKGDLKQIDAGAMDPSGRSLTNAGRICGMIGTILFALSVVAVIALFALGVLGSLWGSRGECNPPQGADVTAWGDLAPILRAFSC